MYPVCRDDRITTKLNDLQILDRIETPNKTYRESALESCVVPSSPSPNLVTSRILSRRSVNKGTTLVCHTGPLFPEQYYFIFDRISS